MLGRAGAARRPRGHAVEFRGSGVRGCCCDGRAGRRSPSPTTRSPVREGAEEQAKKTHDEFLKMFAPGSRRGRTRPRRCVRPSWPCSSNNRWIVLARGNEKGALEKATQAWNDYTHRVAAAAVAMGRVALGARRLRRRSWPLAQRAARGGAADLSPLGSRIPPAGTSGCAASPRSRRAIAYRDAFSAVQRGAPGPRGQPRRVGAAAHRPDDRGRHLQTASRGVLG